MKIENDQLVSGSINLGLEVILKCLQNDKMKMEFIDHGNYEQIILKKGHSRNVATNVSQMKNN